MIQGIAPRLEFGSDAKIKEVKVPKHMQSTLANEFSVSNFLVIFPIE